MPEITVYFHDPVEVDPATSWAGLSRHMTQARLVDITRVNDRRVTDLFGYARPDAVITVDGKPVVSIEQTQMNPSGHNIPQRFSSQVRAAELGVPSILYYPAFSRRTYSDSNVRYLNIRVPLAQLRLSRFFQTPAISVFWPTDPVTKLPQTGRDAHQEIANIVDEFIARAGTRENLLNLTEVQQAFKSMKEMCSRFGDTRRYKPNPYIRHILSQGFGTSLNEHGYAVDPPQTAKLVATYEYLSSLRRTPNSDVWRQINTKLLNRQHTLVFTGTANQKKSDSEHPWPGYLTLLDILYLRSEQGKLPSQRLYNLVYRLPVDVNMFIARMNQTVPPTATYIVDTFADLIELNGGVVLGRPQRGNNTAVPSLYHV